MSTCKDCLHIDVCKYYALYDKDSIISCDNFKNKADYVKVKHGHWKQNPHCKRIYFCSECGRHIEDGSNTPTEFFPYCHCGAKMDGKEENNA